jgi:ribA/ribD-fused uncharacterized protein
MTETQPVMFGGRGDPPRFAPFSNFHSAPIRLEGKIWATMEHFYQAQKAFIPSDVERVRCCVKAWQAKAMGRRIPLHPDWEDRKVWEMYRGVREKFRQHRGLRQLLLSTGLRPIHENRPDPYWGGGPNYPEGQDLLGKILVLLRREFYGS